MNQRIRELADQANLTDYFHWTLQEEGFTDLEKFAELIVRECASIDFYNLAGVGLCDHDRASQVIKEHFGID